MPNHPLVFVAVLSLAACTVRPGSRVEVPVRQPADGGAAVALGQRLGCVLTATSAELRIDFGTRGCFGGTDNALRLDKRPEGFTLEGFTFADRVSRARVAQRPVPQATAARIIRDASAALGFQEVDGDCFSTVRQFAHVAVRCDGQTLTQTFKTETCEGDGVVLPKHHGPPEDHHALELSRIARTALDAWPKRVSSLTPDEEEAEARRWRGLYENGMRVRHDPVEDWERDP